MTTLREKMKREMTLMGLAASTQQRYLHAVIQLHAHYKESPANLSVDAVQDYLLALKKRP